VPGQGSKNNQATPHSTESDSSADSSHESRVTRISSLLSEVADLMRQEGIEKEALHHLRQLQMRVRFAASAMHYHSQTSAALPKRAPEYWLKRESPSENPVAFIQRAYRPWLGRGLTRAHLRQLDSSLYEALKRWLKTNEWPADVDLPTKKELIDRRVAEAQDLSIEHSPEQRERLRLYHATRRREKKRVKED
jgi:hypothetical protein